MPDTWVNEEVCIVVKTYPVPAWNGIEVSCTAAITRAGNWIRLFPVPFRFLSADKRFRKYQWVQLRVRKSSDPRLESFHIDPDSINVLNDQPVSTADKWQARKSIVFPLLSNSYCALKAKRDLDQSPTLGLFKPKTIKRLVMEEVQPNWSDAELARLRQTDMFADAPPKELEKIPHKISYEFTCAEDNCPGHTFMCSDWEMGESYRQWRQKYGVNWEKPFRDKFEHEMIAKRDTHFYVGTIHQHPANWIIVGLFYPPL